MFHVSYLISYFNTLMIQELFEISWISSTYIIRTPHWDDLIEIFNRNWFQRRKIYVSTRKVLKYSSIVAHLLPLDFVAFTAVKEVDDLFSVQYEDIATIHAINRTWHFSYPHSSSSLHLQCAFHWYTVTIDVDIFISFKNFHISVLWISMTQQTARKSEKISEYNSSLLYLIESVFEDVSNLLESWANSPVFVPELLSHNYILLNPDTFCGSKSSRIRTRYVTSMLFCRM